MSNPQLENGYIKIATEIWEALIKYRISGEEMKCLMFIIRKTYGWNKKQDDISLYQFGQATDMIKPSICRAIKKLKDKNIIFVSKKANRTLPTYEFNKKYKTWKALAKRLIVSKIDNRYQKSKSKLTKLLIPTLYTKDTITKDTPLLIYNFYKTEINPLKKSSVRAKENIKHYLKKYSQEQLIGSIKNYKTVCGDDPEYRKDPANFFGKKDRYFIDYIPENFEPIKKETYDPFKECSN